MEDGPFRAGRIFLERLPHGADLLQSLNAFCRERQVQAGYLSVIGTVSRGAFAFYDQDEKIYRPVVLEEALEIVNCQGNVSLWEGNPMVHAHLSLARPDGTTLAGHLIEGNVLFAGELALREFLGPQRLRRPDPLTGLNLWH